MVRTYSRVIAVLLVSAQAAIAGQLNPKVLVTVPPLVPYTDNLLRGIGQADSLLRPGQDPHSFTLSPSQRQALAEADVIVVPDRTMHAVLASLLEKEEKRGARIVELLALKGAKPLPYTKNNPWLKLASHKDDHQDDGAYDPHLWLDPIRMAAIARPLAEAIADAAPSHRAQLVSNAKDLSFHLREEVNPALRKLFEATPRHAAMNAKPFVPFITYHAAYQYFLKRYALEQFGEVTQRPESYLGAKTVHDVIDSAGTLSIRCVITESEGTLVKSIATASDAKIVKLSPEALYTPNEAPPADWVRDGYDRLLQKTAISFAGCL